MFGGVTEDQRPWRADRLRESALVAAREWVALAALARQPQDGAVALRALVEAAADDPEAFGWLWALLREGSGRWQQIKLSGVAAVPAQLHEEVEAFIAETPDPLAPRPAMAPAANPAALLLRAVGGTDVGLSAAKRVLRAEGDGARQVRAAALEVLGGSRDAEGRALVVEEIRSTVAEQRRPARLVVLQPPLGDAEAREVVDILGYVKDHPIEDADFDAVAGTVARLPLLLLAAFLFEPWRRPEGRDKVLSRLPGLLPLEQLTGLLDAAVDVDPDVVAELVRSAAQGRSIDDVAVLAPPVFARFGEPVRAPFWQRLVHELEMAARRAGRREPAVLTLWQCTIAASDQASPAALARLLRSGELAEAASGHGRDPGAARRIGDVAGELLAVDMAGWVEEVIAAADGLPADGEGEFWKGVSWKLPSGDLPAELVERVLVSEVAPRWFANGGHGEQLIAATSTGDAAVTLLARAEEDLSDDEVTALLAKVHWADPGPQGYLEAVGLAADRTAVIGCELDRVVTSLSGPEASAAPGRVVAGVCRSAVEAGVREIATGTTAALQVLLELPDPDVVEAACAWIRAVELAETDGECDHDRVHLVAATDDANGGRVQVVHELRVALGARLAGLAQDATRATGARVADLELAATVEPAAARAAALDLGDAPIAELRAAAARVLAATDGDEADLPRIDELLRSQTRSDIRTSLEAAKHRVRSVGVGDALAALNELLVLGEPAARLDPAVLVPDSDHHERFVQAVDLARARASGHDPGAFIAAAINVTDQFVDLVLLAAVDAPGGEAPVVKAADADRIRSNAPGRAEVGTLLGRQHLQQRFPWFATCLVLRQMRTAHPSPLGTTKPLTLTADHVTTAKTLFGSITAGWIDDMYALYSGAAGDEQ